MNLRKIDFSKLKGKRVLLRLDLNSAVYKNKIIAGPRFEEHSKTVKKLSKNNAKIVIITHQGRKGNKDYLENLSQHAKLLKKYSGVKVKYVDDLFGNEAKEKINKLQDGDVLLLKNVRAYKDELNSKYNKNKFIVFSKNFDIYINDAFSICHRDQASITIPPKLISGYAGPVLSEEVEALDKFASLTKKKLLISLGGEKVKDYYPFFKKFKSRKTKFIVGGVLGNYFLGDKKVDLGFENKWMKERGYGEPFKKIKKELKKSEAKIILPLDFAHGEKIRKETQIKNLPIDEKIKDIGKNTIKEFKEAIDKAEVILMKGPMGFSEVPGFSKGTVEILKEVAKRTKQKKLYSLIGGGHMTTTIKEFGMEKNFSHISLSGGALIKYISGEKLPGLEVLKK